ncbi:MAG: hypothetical protein R3C32_09085 [Chloroflexota bacterium]
MTTRPESTGDATGVPSTGASRVGSVQRASGPQGAVARAGPLGRLRPFPFHPVLLAAYPVLFLFAQNLAEVGLGETYQPIMRASAVADRHHARCGPRAVGRAPRRAHRLRVRHHLVRVRLCPRPREAAGPVA